MSTNAKRIGLIVPSVNVVLEQDLRQFLPTQVSAHVTRIRLTGTSQADLTQALDAVPGAASMLADAGMDAIGLACTGASMLGGPGGERALSAEIQAAVGVPATNTTEALLDAFRSLEVRRVALFSPFDDRFNQAEAAMLEAAGLEVVRTVGLGIANPQLCADIMPDDIVTQAVAADDPQADAVFLSCANLRGFAAVAALEKRLGKPVVASNQAIVWAMLRLAGIPAELPSGGRLFTSKLREAA